MSIVLIFLIFLCIYKIEGYIYKRYCFEKLTSDIKFKDTAIFQGEESEIVETISNKKIIPIWWISIRFSISAYLNFNKENVKDNGNIVYRKDIFSIKPYEKLEKHYTFKGERRGCYEINEYSLKTSNFFVEYNFVENIKKHIEMYVYPRVIPELEFDLRLSNLIGEIEVEHDIIEDPFKLRSVREYSTLDSIKKVNWTATAKTGDLKVNEYEYTMGSEITVFLNVERYNSWDSEDLVEEGINIANTLGIRCGEKGISLRLISNCCEKDEDENIDVKSGCENEYYRTLARININNYKEHLSRIIKDNINENCMRGMFIIISHYISDDLQKVILEARAMGINTKWIIPKKEGTDIVVDNDEDIFVWEVIG
ncbi:DUF58 domain-containing protein [uncultured Clostridium sp.]|uniref:DUF58 domain-containing protein n=1 Tax=uncultured Clostridium sp. TaxID=59620 RepID=UPI0025D76587|nr:DUF58 domain-containing protein [uncultured Clostridium sp.]